MLNQFSWSIAALLLATIIGYCFANFRLKMKLRKYNSKYQKFKNLLNPLVGSLAIASEITELVSQNQILANENQMLIERYQILTENLAAAIIIRNSDGKIAYCSPYTETLTGYSVENFYIENREAFLESVHEDDREKYKRAIQVAQLGESFQFRYRFFHRNGMEMWAETRIVPIMDENAELTSSLSVTIDITGLVRHQKEVEAQNRDLEDFSYMISHDLKAPVFTIKGMLSLLHEDFPKEVNLMQEPLRYVQNATHRIEELVKSVLDYSKIRNEETYLDEVDLNQVFLDIRNDFHSQIIEANAEIQIAQNLPKIAGDKLKVYQVFGNLIGNAIKYRDPKRKLLITIQQVSINNQRQLCISIKDTGLGIPEDKLQEIFRPFQRIHSTNIEGTGIGLACVTKLLDKLGGSVKVESKVGEGSNFLVYLNRE